MTSVARDIARAGRALDDVGRKQIPFAAARALNQVAFEVMNAERAAMSVVFKRPRPFTQRGVGVTRQASKTSLIAEVAVRPAEARYLAPYEFGGLHVLPGKGKALLNPKDTKLEDAFGQIKGKPSNLAPPRAGDPVGKRSKALIKRQTGVFVGTIEGKGGPISGFWKHNGKRGLQLLIRFGTALPVHKHLDFRKRGEALVRARFATLMQASLAKALASAKK